jgi:hypothetical protein
MICKAAVGSFSMARNDKKRRVYLLADCHRWIGLLQHWVWFIEDQLSLKHHS